MAVKQLPTLSPIPEPPNRLVGDQERFDTMTFNSLKAQEKMVNEDLNKTFIPALNEFAVDVNASVDAAALSERNAHDSEEVAKRKAGEASGSAGAAKVSEDNAKVSETNALASKNAAALSAESAEADRIAAEAARDEAQDLANVGYVSEGHAGLAKVDGKTTQADASGVITVKDVAIGGNLEDLASARGYLVDEYLPEFPSRTVLSSFDDATTPGNFHVLWNNTTTSAPDGILNKNQYADGVLEVRDNRSASFVSSFARLMQRLTIIGGATRADSARIFVRTQSWGVTREWFPWVELVSYNKFGDGFRNTNGIISVPEYEGATASSAGTSGLVPPAAAGQHESFLTGGGEYKPVLTKISDSVNLADSKTAASAKAVKTAYDLANGKQANLGFTPVQQGGGANQRPNKVYLGWDGGAVRMQVDNTDMGQLVTTLAGQQKAPNAAWADGAQFALRLRREGNVDTIWNWAGQGGQPSHVWGSNDGTNMLAWNPANFSVNYANSANYANGAEYANNAGSVVGTPNINVNNNGFNTLPPGGTWRLIQSDGSGFLQIKGEYAGGTYVGYSKFMYIRIA